MKKKNLVLVLLLFAALWVQSQERSPWAKVDKELAPAIEQKSNSANFTLNVLWEVSIIDVCALSSGWGPVNPTGVATDGDEIFISADNMSQYYKYDFDGTYLGEFTGVDGVGSVVDLNYYDGKFIGGWYSDIIHKFDIENGTLINDVFASVSNGIMAYDSENNIIYSAGERNTGYDNPINVLTGDGELLYAFARENNHVYSGLAYDSRVPCLWGLCKNTSSKNTLVQISLPSGKETGVVFEMSDYLTATTSGKPAGGLSMTYLEDSDSYILTGMVSERFVWGVNLVMDPPGATDASVLSVVSPLTSMGLLGSYPIEIRVKNEGTTAISSIPITCSIDGSSPISYTVSETIAPGEFLDVTLPGSVQFQNYNDQYELEVTVTYPGDENADNNSIIYEVESIEPYYYEPNSYCEYGDGILSFELGDISNLNTGCTNSGYGDYTEMSTNLVIGNSYTAYFATGGPTQSGFMWIDFNNNQVFDNELELVTEQFWIPDGGMQPVELTIPEGVEPGTYRLRGLVEWVLEEFPYFPNAQMDMGYGEMEDYTVIITDQPIDLDAGVYALDMPTRFLPGEVTPSITVKNFGMVECSFEVTATSGTYTSTVMVSNLASKDTELVTFEPMQVVNGDYNLEFCTSLAGDEVIENDCLDYDYRICDIDRVGVLVEIGTGTWCGYCPGAALGADELVANGKEVAVIEYHAGDSYQISAGADRINFYGITAFPTSVFDGNERYEGGSGTV